MKFNKWGIAVAVVLMLVSIANTVVKGNMLYQEYKTVNWPHTTGYLLEKKIVQIEFGKWQYYPYVKYEYRVKDREIPLPFKKLYTGDKIFPSKWEGSKQAEPVTKILDQFNYGSSFNVYYNPEKPSESVLIPSIRRSSVIGMMLSISLFIASILILFFSRKRYKPSQ